MARRAVLDFAQLDELHGSSSPSSWAFLRSAQMSRLFALANGKRPIPCPGMPDVVLIYRIVSAVETTMQVAKFVGGRCRGQERGARRSSCRSSARPSWCGKAFPLKKGLCLLEGDIAGLRLPRLGRCCKCSRGRPTSL